MHHNLDARVEVITPIEDSGLKSYLKFMLNLYLKDNQQRWIMKPDDSFERALGKKDDQSVSIHSRLMIHTKNNLDPVPKSGE